MRIHVVLNGVTFPYFDYCARNHANMADKPGELEFVGYAIDDAGYRLAHDAGFTVQKCEQGRGSVGHLNGIRASQKNLKPGVVNVISDSDCIILQRGWDTTIKELVQEDYGVIATTYEDLGGFSSGNGTRQTYKNRPTFTWCALSPAHDWQFEISCDKDPGSDIQISTQELSDTFGLPIGYTLMREAAWEFPVYVHENNIRHYCLGFVTPSSGAAKAVKTGDDYNTEHSLRDGTPFVAHQRGSMSKPFRAHPISQKFYDACEAYIRENK